MRYVILAITVSRQIEKLIVEQIYVIAGTRIYGPLCGANKFHSASFIDQLFKVPAPWTRWNETLWALKQSSIGC